MKRWLKVLLGIVLALVLTAGGLSLDWCPPVVSKPPDPLLVAASQQPLRAGAASVALDPPFPIPRAGYGPGRASAQKSSTPLTARAVVVDSGGTSFGIVVADALLIPTEVADEVRSRAGLSEVWVVATHSHSSFGGFDRRWVAEIAAMGGYSEAARTALVKGTLEALQRAGSSLRPCTVSAGTLAPPDLSVPRSGAASDGRLTRVAFEAPDGPIGELLVASAHPTTAPRDSDTLDADWPGAVAAARESQGSGVTLVVQGAAGNASVAFRDSETPAAWAARLTEAAKAVPLRSAGAEGMVLVRVGVTLPQVDGSRIVPGALRPAAKNVLCTQGDAYVTVSLARLGALTLLAIPGEPSFAAGRALEEKGGADRLVSLAGGYLGYVESPELVQKGEGESKRQYYGPGLQAALEDGARIAFEAMALMLQPPRPLPGQEPAPAP